MGQTNFSGPVKSDNGFIGPNVTPSLVAMTPLTGAFGTTGTAIADVTTTFTQSILNNNFRALEDRLNAILAALKTGT